MAKKYYVIWKGEKTGVFDSWPEVKALTQGRNDAQYMGFPSQAQAQAAFASTYTKALTQRNLEKRKQSATNSPVNSYAKPSSKLTAKAAPITSCKYQIYSDGACSPNPGQSGTGMAIYVDGKLTELWYGYYNDYGTNNTAELNGILAAFQYAEKLAPEKVQILSDSKYGIDCITKWAKGWQAKGWKRGKGEEIKNLAVIQQCYEYYQRNQQRLDIVHVKGHADIEGNELADRMAVLARMSQESSYVKYDKSLNIAEILTMPSG